MEICGNLKWWLANGILFLMWVATSSASEEEEAAKYLAEIESSHNVICNKAKEGNWLAGVNINNETQAASAKGNEEYTNFMAEVQKQINTRFANHKTYQNKRLRRAFKTLAYYGPAGMPKERVLQSQKLSSDMAAKYGLGSVCAYNDPTNCTLKIPHLEAYMRTLTDPKELEHYFTAWHDKMSELVPPEKYKELVDLKNEHAVANGFPHFPALWLAPYEEDTPNWTVETFEKIMIELEQGIAPMYQTLHAYVRMKLRKLPEYAGMIEKCGYLPAHILGNMWAQSWSHLDSKTKPFPNAPALSATSSLKKQGYTVLQMFQVADKFFKDLGFQGMYPEFYEKSVFERPTTGQEMSCHATAWDMCLGKGSTDFRIRQCTAVAHHDFLVVHHEMGHIIYYLEYRDLEFVFRTSANPGFHESIGDAIALAVQTPGHLQCKLGLDLGLGESFCEKKEGPVTVTETDLNFLYLTALDKLAFFPFSMSVDTWRFSVFEGRIKPEDYTKKWWSIRKLNQGIVPPGNRDSPKLFDAAAKFHTVAGIDYIRYFVAGVLNFQFYEAMCIASGEFKPNDPNSKPLYQCDFAGNKEAGKLLKKMLRMGASQEWPDALEAMTGTRKLSIEPLKNYLKPILEHMEKELKDNGEIIGFGDSCEHVEAKKQNKMTVDEQWKALKSGTLF